MDVLLVVAYILLAFLVLWFIYNLLGLNKVTARSFGRKKKSINIILDSNKIHRRKDRTIFILSHLEPLFCIDGEVDYQKLLKAITKIKESAPSSLQLTSEQHDKVASEIDLVCDVVNEKHKYASVRNQLGAHLQVLENHVMMGDKETAISEINTIYKLCISLEHETQFTSKKQFWIGVIIGVLGISISLVQMFIK